MAENTQTRGRRRGANNGQTPPPAAEEKATRRVVMKRERVLIVPDGVEDSTILGASNVLRDAAEKAGKVEDRDGELTEAWTVVGEFEGDTKSKAIEAYAGRPNTPDAKPGAYKAPGVAAFAGGRLYERPPEPKVEAKDLD